MSQPAPSKPSLRPTAKVAAGGAAAAAGQRAPGGLVGDGLPLPPLGSASGVVEPG